MTSVDVQPSILATITSSNLDTGFVFRPDRVVISLSVVVLKSDSPSRILDVGVPLLPTFAAAGLCITCESGLPLVLISAMSISFRFLVAVLPLLVAPSGFLVSPPLLSFLEPTSFFAVLASL